MNSEENSDHNGAGKEEESFGYRPVIVLILIVASVFIFYALDKTESSLDPAGQPTIAVGLPAPDFIFPGLDGKDIRLSDHRGKVVLVNIWATWCPPCVEEMPSMERLYQQFKGDKFEILAVSIDASGYKAVAPFMKRHNLTFPALLDPQAATQVPYRTTGVPESFIIDSEGILVRKVIGPLDWASPAAVKLIGDLLAKT